MPNQVIVEASAGCGKTYKIEQMVLELIEEGLELNEIVIVTFTSAQAKDLKKRIYNRLKQTNSKRAHRSFKLFDEANISTLHSFAQKVIQEAGVIVDFHIDKITSLSEFKKSFKSILRHEIDPNKIGDIQLAQVCTSLSLLKEVHGQYGKKLNVVPYSTWLEKLQTFKKNLPFSRDEFLDDVEILKNLYVKKGTDAIEPLIEAFQSDHWGEKELRLLSEGVKWRESFRPENLRKKPLTDAPHPNMDKYICIETELKPLIDGVLKKENIVQAIALHCQNYKTSLAKEVVVYDDLIRILDEESRNPEFIKYFRSRFKVAIIDEFQDTDDVQWRIFRSLFDRFYLVGDPKQAIYAFRNADIYTYLEAYRSVEHKLTLDTNWRSDPQLIRKLNLLFSSAKNLFTLPAINQSLEYTEVKAGKTGDQGKLTLVECQQNKELYPLISHLVSNKPSEWAIIVRGHREGSKIADFLSQCQIPYLIQRQESMAQSEAGKALFQILEGCKSKKRIKSALLSSLINYSSKELAKLDDLLEWEKEVLRFQGYQEKLNSSFAEFVNAFEADWLERLALNPPLFYEWEALQEEIFDWLKENELKDFFKEAVENNEKRFIGTPEGVKIMTIHTSKGLEFEKVFVLGVTENYVFATEEDLAEMMRLFYVALTRAKTELYIPILRGKKKKNMMNLFLDKVAPELDLVEWAKSIEAELIVADPFLSPQTLTKQIIHSPLTLNRSFKPSWVQSYTRMKEKRGYSAGPLETVLPKGVEMGLCLHALLEKMPFALPVEISLKNSPFEPYENEILSLLTALMEIEIKGKKLKDLASCRQLREVPFTYKSEQGFTTGVIDLVIEIEGEIIIVDWKSHALPDYTDERLAEVVNQESFDLQAQLYYEAGMRTFGKVSQVLFVFVRGPGVYAWTP